MLCWCLMLLACPSKDQILIFLLVIIKAHLGAATWVATLGNRYSSQLLRRLLLQQLGFSEARELVLDHCCSKTEAEGSVLLFKELLVSLCFYHRNIAKLIELLLYAQDQGNLKRFLPSACTQEVTASGSGCPSASSPYRAASACGRWGCRRGAAGI